jgi:hypothetical protein
MDGNPLAAYPWLHLAANLTVLALWPCCGAFILTLAYKVLWPGTWHWRHWSSRVLAYLGLGILLLMLAVAVISWIYGMLSQR